MKKPEEVKKVKDDPTCFECNHYEVCQKWSNAGYLHRDNPKKCFDFTGRSAERRRISALEIVVDEQDKAIQQLEAQVPRWIPVEERLPEKYEHVLVATRFSDEGEQDFEIAYYAYERWRKPEGHLYGRVTHWMPLPEPPKEDAQ